MKTEVEALKRGKSKKEIEKEKTVHKKIAAKVSSLSGSLGKMSEHSDSLKVELAELEKGATTKKGTLLLAKKKQELAKESAKVGALYETMLSELEHKLKIAKAKQEEKSLELASFRESWHEARRAVTDAQAEVDVCKSRVAR